MRRSRQSWDQGQLCPKCCRGMLALVDIEDASVDPIGQTMSAWIVDLPWPLKSGPLRLVELRCRSRPGNAVSGMPILEVDHARRVIVTKRSLIHGYAGIDKEPYTDPQTAMLLSDAKAVLTELLADLHPYVH